MSAARRHSTCRAATLLAALLLVGGCTVTIDNDYEFGSNTHEDRWYTAGARLERPVSVADDGSVPTVLDNLILEAAQLLPSAGDGEWDTISTASGVFGLQMYTPEDVDTTAPVLDDRPYAGWVYVGVMRRDTHLDPDALRRRDVESTFELDLGLVGPAARMESVQKEAHHIFGGDDAQGWDNQLEDEPGVVLRATRRWRADYDLLSPESGLAWDLSPRVDGALGNIDTHVGIGGAARLGWNLSRALDPVVGDPTQLLPGRRPVDPPASVFFFADLDGRFVIQNLFLEGNTFKDSQSVNEERFVGEGTIGLGWERAPWRVVYGKHARSHEFEGQSDDQIYSSLIVSWTPRP